MNKPLVCIAALAACAVLGGPVEARDHEVTIKISVDTAGLDLGDPTVAREVYRRIKHAAFTACLGGNRVDLKPAANFAGCYEATLAKAVQSVDQPQLSAAYLATHTLQDAVTYGFEVPVRLVSK